MTRGEELELRRYRAIFKMMQHHSEPTGFPGVKRAPTLYRVRALVFDPDTERRRTATHWLVASSPEEAAAWREQTRLYLLGLRDDLPPFPKPSGADD